MVSPRNVLKLCRDLNQAIEYYFQNHADEMNAKKSSAAGGKADPKKCIELFQKYTKKEVMDQDAIEAFFNDLGVDATTDIIAILVA